MKIKKILLVRPPRLVWPYVKEADNFLPPLHLCCVAAAIRTHLPDIEIKIIDCPSSQTGWKSLHKLICDQKPDIVGAGEGIVYYYEAARLFQMVKEIDPHIYTIAGGHFFSWMVEVSLKNYHIDSIVRFEGEETIRELITALEHSDDLSGVKGLAFMRGQEVITTPARQFISNLDDLPMPAFDLLEMERYAGQGHLWPYGVPLEHSRGCIDTCSFCSLWTYWGDHVKTDIERGGLEVRPYYRTKSVQRTLEEVDLAYNKYGRRFIFWADPTFNVDPTWTDEFCEKLLERGYSDLKWWAFARADFLLRDEKLGILEKMVKAGLMFPLIGVERRNIEDIKSLKKKTYSEELVKEVFSVFKRKYPHVYRYGTLVTCLPFDTKEKMFDLVDYVKELDIEHHFFNPAIPAPGTYLYEEAKKEKLLEEKDFLSYNWDIPIMRSAVGLTQKDFLKLNNQLYQRFMICCFFRIFLALFSPFPHKRRIKRYFFFNTLRQMIIAKIQSIFKRDIPKGSTGFFMQPRKPKWYDA